MTKSQKLTVLCVEDSATDAQLAQELIGSEVDIIHATSLADCHRSGEADIALLDLNLRETMGIETVTSFRKGLPHLPVVVLTHLDDPAIEAMCIAAGAHAFYRKGEFDAKSLIRSMRSAVIAFALKEPDMEELNTHKKSLAEIRSLTEVILNRIKNIENR